MGLIAAALGRRRRRWLERTLVTTVMSNLGLERMLAGRGIAMRRTRVGDRYVVEEMRAGGFNLGGEQSGHIVMTDLVTTGDGLLAALQVLAALVEVGTPARPSSAASSSLIRSCSRTSDSVAEHRWRRTW